MMMESLSVQQRRLSISNLAWPAENDDEALDLVAELEFEGVELAPSKVFGDLSAVSMDTVYAYRRRVEDRGLVFSALQALFFGVHGAHLFESPASRERMASHLRRVAEIAGSLGARACVFGSPTLRDPGALSLVEAHSIAEEFLHTVAPDYAARGINLCIEANPPLYQCRFITRTEEALNLVERVDTPGVAMQLDIGTIFINGEDPGIIHRAERRIGHVHVSEPNLEPLGTSGVNHAAVAEALRESIYPHWVSIEMKAADNWRQAMRHAYSLTNSVYYDGRSSR